MSLKLKRCFALVLIVLSFADKVALAEQKIRTKIGVSVPLTGPGATYGNDVLSAIRFANDELGEGRYELVIEDDKCSPKEAAAVAQRFITGGEIRYVLGLPCSGTALASAPIYERSKTLVLASIPSAREFSQAGDYMFRMRGDEGPVAELLAQSLKDKFTSVGILSEQTEYAESMRRELVERLRPIAVVSEDFLSSAPNLKAEVFRLKRNQIQALVVLSQSELMASLAVKAVREVDRELPIYGSNAFASGLFRELVKGNPSHLTVVSQPPNRIVLTEEGQALFRKLEERYGKQSGIDYSFYCSFESFRALKAAIESGRDPRAYLNETKFDGIFGPYSFDQNGDLMGIKPTIWTLDK